jgi:hypothetical protein
MGAGGGATESKPFCGALGVAAWTFIGGGCSANGFADIEALDLASTNRVPTPEYPSSAAETVDVL